MEINLMKLQNGVKKIFIDEEISFSRERLKSTTIIELKDCHVTAIVFKDNQDEYIIDGEIKGTMTLPCSISLKPVDYNFETKINGNVYELLKEIDENYKKEAKTIDIFPIIWENVLMEIPLKVTAEDVSDVKMHGDGWALITTEKQNENSELLRLKEMLKERGV